MALEIIPEITEGQRGRRDNSQRSTSFLTSGLALIHLYWPIPIPLLNGYPSTLIWYQYELNLNDYFQKIILFYRNVFSQGFYPTFKETNNSYFFSYAMLNSNFASAKTFPNKKKNPVKVLSKKTAAAAFVRGGKQRLCSDTAAPLHKSNTSSFTQSTESSASS